ncbi:MAG TPA: hypothetical protein VHI11_06185 [Jiangellaceae bacterium]|nr:hypothetical protein [Jiangellaceae bacterium]
MRVRARGQAALVGAARSRVSLLCKWDKTNRSDPSAHREVPMDAARSTLAALLLIVTVALSACGGDAQQALADARDRAAELGDEISSAVDSARDEIESAGESAAQIDEALDGATQAAQEARDALEQRASDAGDEANQRLEDARTGLEEAEAQLEKAAESVPDSVQSALDDVRTQLAELRDQIDQAL